MVQERDRLHHVPAGQAVMRRGAVVVAAMLVAGCGHLPPPRSLTCAVSARPQIEISADGQTASTTLSVMTYNIEGLSWPARSGRATQLRRIGAILNRLQAEGRGPDVVLFQEMFSRSAVSVIAATDYPALVGGPPRTQRSNFRSDIQLPGKANPRRGEMGFRLLTGGLAIASRYPITASLSEAYARASCAGFDCLSNKGILLAHVALPGVPAPVELFNTHMNSQAASRVAPERHLAAHNAQTGELVRFVHAWWDRRDPVILGGDFNMRGAPRRFAPFGALQPLELVHRYCYGGQNGCAVEMSWDGDAPWLDTQDLQLFAAGTSVDIRPIRARAMFDGSADSPHLSDHDAFAVTYRLSWPNGSRPINGRAC
jgi:endonuclease/exonuclease/phosphatase family metal-dependent hydrolase